jgi:hypothetical protein
MTPAFAEKQASLLGREDFFPAFGIQFGSNAQIGPHFIIEH